MLGAANFATLMAMQTGTTTIRKMACLLGASGIDFDSAQSDNGVDYFYPEPVEG